jgi:hypothetical protein
VPSEDSNIDSDRLASAQRTAGALGALPVPASSCRAIIGGELRFLAVPERALRET